MKSFHDVKNAVVGSFRVADLSRPFHLFIDASDAGLGWVHHSSDHPGSSSGTYLHGIFDNGPWRRRWLNRLRHKRGLPALSEQQPHHSRQREVLLDRLADAFEEHVNLDPLLRSST